MGYVGDKFTRCNNLKAPKTVRCRLDRVCVISVWLNHCPDSYVEHLQYSGSDHVPLLFRLRRPLTAVGGERRRPIQFEAQWFNGYELEVELF